MSAIDIQERPAPPVPAGGGIGAWAIRRTQRPPVEGSSARRLELSAPLPVSSTGSTRVPLSVLPGAARRSRASSVVLSLLALVLALSSILVLNIQISHGQYQLVELRATEQALSQQNEALTQDLEFYNAPQNLAVMAADLGMVPAQGSGTVDLTDGAVRGDPLPAQPQEDHEILVAHAYQTGSEAAERAAERTEERERERAEKRERERAEQDRTDAERQARQVTPAGAVSEGGSLAAPQQRTPGQ